MRFSQLMELPIMARAVAKEIAGFVLVEVIVSPWRLSVAGAATLG